MIIITFIGLRSKNFPSKGALIGLLLLAASSSVAPPPSRSSSIEEQYEREEGQKGIGEETTDAAAINIIRRTRPKPSAPARLPGTRSAGGRRPPKMPLPSRERVPARWSDVIAKALWEGSPVPAD